MRTLFENSGVASASGQVTEQSSTSMCHSMREGGRGGRADDFTQDSKSEAGHFQTDLVVLQNLIYLRQIHARVEIILKADFDLVILFVHGLAFN